jgi:hypothetical protein
MFEQAAPPVLSEMTGKVFGLVNLRAMGTRVRAATASAVGVSLPPARPKSYKPTEIVSIKSTVLLDSEGVWAGPEVSLPLNLESGIQKLKQAFSRARE